MSGMPCTVMVRHLTTKKTYQTQNNRSHNPFRAIPLIKSIYNTYVWKIEDIHQGSSVQYQNHKIMQSWKVFHLIALNYFQNKAQQEKLTFLSWLESSLYQKYSQNYAGWRQQQTRLHSCRLLHSHHSPDIFTFYLGSLW